MGLEPSCLHTCTVMVLNHHFDHQVVYHSPIPKTVITVVMLEYGVTVLMIQVSALVPKHDIYLFVYGHSYS